MDLNRTLQQVLRWVRLQDQSRPCSSCPPPRQARLVLVLGAMRQINEPDGFQPEFERLSVVVEASRPLGRQAEGLSRSLNQYPFHFIEAHLVISFVVEARGAGALVVGHLLLRYFELPAIAQGAPRPRRRL